MAYDALQESRRLIADGAPDVLGRLTRRRRWIPLAVDVDGDVAVTAFLRRGHSGSAHREHWVLERRDGDWTLLGGSGGSDEPQLERRPSAAGLGGLARLDTTSWTARQAGGPLRAAAGVAWAMTRRGLPAHDEHPWGARGVSSAGLTLAAEVARVRVGARELTVPSHGYVCVVWSTRQPPVALALDADHHELGRVGLARPTRPSSIDAAGPSALLRSTDTQDAAGPEPRPQQDPPFTG